MFTSYLTNIIIGLFNTEFIQNKILILIPIINECLKVAIWFFRYNKLNLLNNSNNNTTVYKYLIS
jgi:hypothetical protein